MKVEFSSRAYKDIKRAYDIFAERNKYILQPERWAKKIIDSCLPLAESPLSGYSLEEEIKLETPYRFLIVDDFLVFYIIKDESVIISRVILGCFDYFGALIDTHRKDREKDRDKDKNEDTNTDKNTEK